MTDTRTSFTTPQDSHIPAPSTRARRGEHRPQIVAIGASTGGPQALERVLEALPPDFNLPIVIVQHMPDVEFLALLTERIGDATGRPTRLAEHQDVIRAGHTYIAPGRRHLEIVSKPTHAGPVVRLSDAPPENFARPAVDPLFRSVAATYENRALGVVLSGMGIDGLAGAASIVRHGGRVFVQDEESSVVWGMPGAVAKAGLATEIAPIERMSEVVVSACADSDSAPAREET